jgi:dTDP-4-amino-4,6-dideoxygalactose transaminase
MIQLFEPYIRGNAYYPNTTVIELDKLFRAGYIGQGQQVEKFEQLMSDYLGCDAITVNSATSGLHLLFKIFGNDGDEILTTPLTCAASVFPIIHERKRIKWVDVGEDCNIDLDDLERKLSPTTKGILLVHWGGNPINLDEIDRIRNKCYDLYRFYPYIIQDCAHSMGSQWRGRHLGDYYDSVYSLQAIKHLTAGDGGLICSGSSERLKLLRWYGIDREAKGFRCSEDIQEAGFKYHMNDINATIGIENFKDLNWIIERHKDNAKYYLYELPWCSWLDFEKMPYFYLSSHWLYTIYVKDRPKFIKYMADNGVQVSQVHSRLDTHSCLREFKTSLPGLDKIDSTRVCIPVGWHVTKEDREKIVELIKDY